MSKEENALFFEESSNFNDFLSKIDKNSISVFYERNGINP